MSHVIVRPPAARADFVGRRALRLDRRERNVRKVRRDERDRRDALAEARHLGAARDIGKDLRRPGRIEIPQQAVFRAPEIEIGLPGLIAVRTGTGRCVRGWRSEIACRRPPPHSAGSRTNSRHRTMCSSSGRSTRTADCPWSPSRHWRIACCRSAPLRMLTPATSRLR